MRKAIRDKIEKDIDKDISRKKAIVILCITVILVIASIILAIKFDFVDSLFITELILPLGIIILVCIAFWIYKKIHK